MIFKSNIFFSLLSLSLRCTSWESIDRPSISSILCDLAPLLSSCSSQQNIIGSGFDHTDSLGHVMIEFELDDDEDIDLMRFLQVRQFIIYCYINAYLSISSLQYRLYNQGYIQSTIFSIY